MVRSQSTVVNYTPAFRIALRHPLILDGFTSNPRLRPDDTLRPRHRASASQKHCACTFYLVFKEPDPLPAGARARRIQPFAPPVNLRQGNLTILLTVATPVNPCRGFSFGLVLISLQRRCHHSRKPERCWGSRSEVGAEKKFALRRPQIAAGQRLSVGPEQICQPPRPGHARE